jgi:hypothetical protein
VALDTCAVFVIVEPAASPAEAASTTVNIADWPAGRRSREQERVPVPPAAGAAQRKAGPPFWDSDTKVVPAGTASVS